MSQPTIKQVLLDPIFNNNPIGLQILGICLSLGGDFKPKNCTSNVDCLNFGNRIFWHVHLDDPPADP